MQPLLQQKAVTLTYAENVSVALFIQHAVCIHHIILSYVVSLA